jgi:atrazine chlorohydrolase/5-methylthioadenosine/S-adenosylhomocysteine deaminase/melamine deaminase
MSVLVVKNGAIVTMDGKRRIIENGTVVAENGRITYVGPTDKSPPSRESDVTIDAEEKAILPGFINAHCHSIQSLLRGGISQDKGLMEWLLRALAPGLSVFTPEDAYVGATLFCLEALASGVTTIVDNGDWGKVRPIADATIKAFQDIGVRAVYARMFKDVGPSADYGKLYDEYAKATVESTEEAIDDIEGLIKDYHGSTNGRISVWPAPSNPYTLSSRGFERVRDLMKGYGVMATLHFAEPKPPVTWMGRSTEPLVENDFLGPNVLLAHSVWVDDKDLRLFKEYGVKIVHLPCSNAYLGCGIAPISQMIARGITVGLGTDDANCNENANFFSEMKMAALLQKGVNMDPGAITAEKILEMATIDGASAIGLEKEIGSLEVGKRADMVVVSLRTPWFTPCHSIPATLVYQGSGATANFTIVDGKVIIRQGKPTFLGDRELMEFLGEAQRKSEAIVERAGVVGLSKRPWRSP